jgi:hypothetical protein
VNPLSNYCAELDAGGAACYVSGVTGPARVSEGHWSFSMRVFVTTIVVAFGIVTFAGGAEDPRSEIRAPEVVLHLADAYIAALPLQEKEGHQNDLRDEFFRSFFWGFVMPDGKLTGGSPVDSAGEAAGRQYRLSNPDKLNEIMQGFGYVATNAVGTWSRGFELSRFRRAGDSGRGWWLWELPEPAASGVIARDIPPSGGPVRIAGFLSAKGRYGHLGMCDRQFYARDISLVKIGQADGAAPRVSAADTNALQAPQVAITNLLAHREAYQGKRVEVSGYYLGFFEHYALYESKSNRSFTNSLWIDPFREQSGYRQNISGARSDFRGNVRIIGTFHYRPDLRGVGHLNGWPAEITNLELFEKTE